MIPLYMTPDPLQLDPQLSELVQSGKLSDGCKIVLFSGVYQVDGPRATLRLSYNAVRKASDSAKKGFVSPAKLDRYVLYIVGLLMAVAECEGCCAHVSCACMRVYMIICVSKYIYT